MSVHGLRNLVGAVVLGAALVALAGCGDSESSGGSAAQGGGPGVAEAQSLAEKATTRPTSIGLEAAIGKEVPTGKKVVFISCGVEACEIQGDIIKQGAADLGWTAEAIGTDGSPEQLQNAFETALRQGADAVILNAVNRDAVAKQIEKAEQQGVAFVTCCSIEAEGDGILRNVAGKENSARSARTSRPRSSPTATARRTRCSSTSRPSRSCRRSPARSRRRTRSSAPTAQYATLDIPATSLGKDAPDRIVSYLRSHPQVNYVVLSVSNALGAGLPAALKAAGLADKVKLVGQSGDTLTFQDMAAGNIESVVPFDYYAVDYLMLDALARHFAGVPVEQAQPPTWIVTPDNMPAEATEGLFPVVETYRDEFNQLWGK